MEHTPGSRIPTKGVIGGHIVHCSTIEQVEHTPGIRIPTKGVIGGHSIQCSIKGRRTQAWL